MPSDDDEMNEQLPTILGVGSAVVNLVTLTAVGEIALENVVFGGVAGLLAGVGGFLCIPWFLRVSAAQDADDADQVPFRELLDQVPGNPQVGVFGLGLELGGIVMLAVGFAIGPDLVAGTAAGLAVALAVYLAGSFALSR